MEQLSLCATITEPVLYSQGAETSEARVPEFPREAPTTMRSPTTEQPPCATTREIMCSNEDSAQPPPKISKSTNHLKKKNLNTQQTTNRSLTA